MFGLDPTVWACPLFVQGWTMGFYPPPAALTGYPPRGVSAAQGRLMPQAFAAHSNLRLSWLRILPRSCTKSPAPLSGTGLFVQGWTMGFEPTTTGTTIRGSTAELRPPLVFALACGGNIHAVGTECKPNFAFGLKFVHRQWLRRASTQMADQVSRRS